MTHMEMIRKISEILDDNCEEPADEIFKVGKCLQEIGSVLKGRSLTDARAIMQAVASMQQIKSNKDKKTKHER